MKKNILLLVFLIMSLSVHAEWVAETGKDMLTGTETVIIVGISDASVATIGKPALVLRWKGDAFEMYCVWGGYSMSNKYNLFRYSETIGPVPFIGSLSTDKEAIFITEPSLILDALRDMDPEDTFVLAGERATGVLSIAEWTIGNLFELIEEYSK